MNFLAHYLLALESSKSSGFVVGSILPDIAKRAGFATSKSLLTNENEFHPEILAGLKLHLEADRHFHNSTLFTAGMAIWKQGLEPEKVGYSKTFFLHHLLFEMWLDRLLLIENPDAGKNMYLHLNQVQFADLENFTSLFYQDLSGKVYRTFLGFLKRKFILSYTSNVDFVEIAAQVFSQVTQQKVSSELDTLIANKLNELEGDASNFLSLWEDFKTNFPKTDLML